MKLKKARFLFNNNCGCIKEKQVLEQKEAHYGKLTVRTGADTSRASGSMGSGAKGMEWASLVGSGAGRMDRASPVGSGAGGVKQASPVGSRAGTQPPALPPREGPQPLPCPPCFLLAAFKWMPVV